MKSSNCSFLDAHLPFKTVFKKLVRALVISLCLPVAVPLRCEWELDRDSVWDEQRCSESYRAASGDRRIRSSTLSDVHGAQEPSDKNYVVWETSGLRWGRCSRMFVLLRMAAFSKLFSLYVSVCADNNHVRTWTVTRFRGMISTQPGSTPLASFKILSLEETESHGSYCSGNDIGQSEFRVNTTQKCRLLRMNDSHFGLTIWFCSLCLRNTETCNLHE